MAATIYVAPRFLVFVSLFIVVCSPFYGQPLSNGSILPVWSLVRTGLDFPSQSGCFYQSSKGMPRRPAYSWHKRGYFPARSERFIASLFQQFANSVKIS